MNTVINEADKTYIATPNDHGFLGLNEWVFFYEDMRMEHQATAVVVELVIPRRKPGASMQAWMDSCCGEVVEMPDELWGKTEQLEAYVCKAIKAYFAGFRAMAH